MTTSTVENADYLPDAAMTPLTPQVSQNDAPAAEEEHLRALSVGEPFHPDPAARARIAAVLYQITGWEIFGYAELAASETAEEAAEHRRILRRRRPPWADED
jgi:hypothetical protein